MNVEELLIQKKIPYIPKGKDFVVRCLNPEHDDSNPSMRIDQIDGRFNCFSCEFKGNLFSFFGEKASGLQLKRDILTKKIQEKRAENVGLTFPKDYLPYVGNWRNISPKTYKTFEAFEHVGKDYVSRINFPIRDISGKIVAFQGRHTSGGTPKYKFTPPGAKLPLFPQVSPRLGEIILVEGIYDVINLHDKGMTNVCCCFGTNNINEDKLLMLSMKGATKIGIFFDGDDAGQKAAENVKVMCEKVGLVARNIFMKELDPGALTETQVRKLESRLYA
jgi:DNA primase